MRVWKLENDLIFREEKDLVRPEYIENAIISKNSNSLSTAKLKRSIGYIFNKKDFKNHLGYVSAIQESRGQLLIEKNGKFDGLLKVSLFNTSNELLKEIELSQVQHLLDVSGLKKGKYILKLQCKSLSSSAFIEL